MKTIILFLSALMISFTSLAASQTTTQSSKSFETSISESKPGPSYNKKKRAKQVKKMRKKAAKSSKRSGGDLTNFNCRRR